MTNELHPRSSTSIDARPANVLSPPSWADASERELVTVVVPARGGRCGVRALRDALAVTLRDPWELLIVDDFNDEAVGELAELATTDLRVRVLYRNPERRLQGYNGAIRAGFAAAAGEVLVAIDEDLPQAANVVVQLVETLARRRADVVVAARYHYGGSGAGIRNLARFLAGRACRLVALGGDKTLVQIGEYFGCLGYRL